VCPWDAGTENDRFCTEKWNTSYNSVVLYRDFTQSRRRLYTFENLSVQCYNGKPAEVYSIPHASINLAANAKEQCRASKTSAPSWFHGKSNDDQLKMRMQLEIALVSWSSSRASFRLDQICTLWCNVLPLPLPHPPSRARNHASRFRLKIS
jgi:hypothetical protein